MMGHASADGGHECLLLSGVTSEAACCERVVRGTEGSKLSGTAVPGPHPHRCPPAGPQRFPMELVYQRKELLGAR